ncbi:putative toxin-antitoxin system toxin component, PIN family [soil metagenome]
MQRVVVDTNVWVSAFLNPAGPPARVLAALDQRRFTLVASEYLLAEIAEVLTRPRVVRRYAVTPEARDIFIELLHTRAVTVPTDGSVQICRDPDDDMVIETAVRGRADMLVTRDDDLKGFSEVMEYLDAVGVAVVSVQRFLDILEL